MNSSSYNSATAARWEATRAKGRMHFILVRGVLLYGGSLAILLTFFNGWWHDSLSHEAADLIGCVVGGLTWGLLMWNGSEAAYRVYHTKCELALLSAKP